MSNSYVFEDKLGTFQCQDFNAMAKSTCSVMVSNCKVLYFMLDPICLVQDCTEAQGSSSRKAVEWDMWKLHQIFLHPDHVLGEIVLS